MKTLNTMKMFLLGIVATLACSTASAQGAEYPTLNIPYELRDVPPANWKSWQAETYFDFETIGFQDALRGYVSSGISSVHNYTLNYFTMYEGIITLRVVLLRNDRPQYVGRVTVKDTWTMFQTSRPKIVIKEWSPIGE